ncbi:Beta-fructofuranosidase, insoluble isoenzyme CWINV1 [Capsicum chinense]|nr:Beta-fructofuranosidase, insoluble isoenzyme CWINV1 [Capsicum chinense]
MLYTGGDSQNVQFQNLAVPKDPSDPYLVEWVKSSNNPIMTPNEEEKELFRDPSTACEKKRRIFIASVSESTSKEIDIAKGWSGLQSFPRKIWLNKGGKQLVQCPVEEIKMLRTNQVELHNVILDAGSKLEISVTAAQLVARLWFHSLVSSFRSDLISEAN